MSSGRTVPSDVAEAVDRLRVFGADAVAASRVPLSARQMLPSIYLLGLLLDCLTTCLLGIVPGVREGNPFAAFGMSVAGGPAVYMALGLVLLAPAAMLLAARPRTLVPIGIWVALAAAGLVKVYVGVSNAVLMVTV